MRRLLIALSLFVPVSFTFAAVEDVPLESAVEVSTDVPVKAVSPAVSPVDAPMNAPANSKEEAPRFCAEALREHLGSLSASIEVLHRAKKLDALKRTYTDDGLTLVDKVAQQFETLVRGAGLTFRPERERFVLFFQILIGDLKLGSPIEISTLDDFITSFMLQYLRLHAIDPEKARETFNKAWNYSFGKAPDTFYRDWIRRLRADQTLVTALGSEEPEDWEVPLSGFHFLPQKTRARFLKTIREGFNLSRVAFVTTGSNAHVLKSFIGRASKKELGLIGPYSDETAREFVLGVLATAIETTLEGHPKP